MAAPLFGVIHFDFISNFLILFYQFIKYCDAVNLWDFLFYFKLVFTLMLGFFVRCQINFILKEINNLNYLMKQDLSLGELIIFFKCLLTDMLKHTRLLRFSKQLCGMFICTLYFVPQ